MWLELFYNLMWAQPSLVPTDPTHITGSGKGAHFLCSPIALTYAIELSYKMAGTPSLLLAL
jgi:hypothetical protein